MTAMPNIIVREELATLAVITGTLSDVYRSPSMWLDKKVRSSLRALATEHAPHTMKVLSFLEELALVTGLTQEEALAHNLPSNIPDEHGDEPATDGHQTIVTLTQTVSAKAYESSGLGYVLLAGQRARTKVSLSPTPQSPLRIEIETEVGEGQRLAHEAGYVLTIGPGEPTPRRRALWSDIEVDAVSPAVIFKGELAYSESAAALPLVVRLPLRRPDQEGPQRGTLQFAIRPSFATVGHLARLRAARELLATRGAEIQLLLGEERRVLGKFDVVKGDTVRLPGGLPDAVLDALLMVGTSIPAPWFGIEQDLQDLVSAPAPEKAAVFGRVIARPASEKPKVTATFIDYVTSNGIKFDEDFLGYFPDLHFAPFQLAPGSPITQEEFNQRWDKREQLIKFTGYDREPYPAIAVTLIEWSEEPQKPFPIRFHPDIDFSDVRTTVEIAFEPARDRLWYIEYQ